MRAYLCLLLPSGPPIGAQSSIRRSARSRSCRCIREADRAPVERHAARPPRPVIREADRVPRRSADRRDLAGGVVAVAGRARAQPVGRGIVRGEPVRRRVDKRVRRFSVLFTGAWPQSMRSFLIRFADYYYRVWTYVAIGRERLPPIRAPHRHQSTTDVTGTETDDVGPR